MTLIFRRLLVGLRFAMPLLYLSVGIIVLATDAFSGAGKFRVPVGIILIVYAAFRTWRIFKDLSDAKSDEDKEQ